MKIDIRDMLEHFSDDSVEIHNEADISYDRILSRTMRKIKEDKTMTRKSKITSAALIAAVITALLSISVFAAYQMLSPKEIAEHLEYDKLAEIFTDEDTLFNMEPQISGDYTFELLGIASGKGLSGFVEEADKDKSYIVGSVRRTDGEKLLDFPGIMVTPLVDGYKPWAVNAFTIGGGRSEFIADDDSADYFIFECDNIEIFADHKIHFAMYETTEEFGMSPSRDMFNIKDDGSIEYSDSFTVAKAMFTIPIEKSKANPEKVKALLEENGIPEDGFKDVEESAEYKTHVSSDGTSIVISDGDTESTSVTFE